MRRQDHGFTLIEILIAVVVVGILSVVVVVGIGALTGKGASAACTASADAARAATIVHYTNTAAYPATVTAMVAASELVLPASATVAASGVAVSTANWVMTMQPGAPPTFSCAATTVGSATTVATTSTTAAATATTVAVAVAVATTVDTTTKAARLCVVDASSVALADATLSAYTNGWKVIGTTTAKGCLDARVPVDTAYVSAQLRGVTRQLRWDDGVRHDNTTEFDFATASRYVRVVDSAGNGVPGAEARYLGDRWETLGTTGKDGCASTELLAGYIYVGAADRGVTVQQVVDLATTPSDSCKAAVVFARAPRFMRVVDRDGNAVAGIASRYYGTGWLPLDPTGKDGCTSIELVGGFIYFGITYDGGESQQGVELAKVPATSCKDAVVFTK